MNIRFVKMQGAGNDYVYIDCLEKMIDNPEKLAVLMSDRHFGIGGDGVILICHSDVADARMRMFNLDGSEGKMCGNGIRCVAKYLYDNKLVNEKLTVETGSGIKSLEVHAENGKAASVTVNMGKAEFSPSLIPVKLDGDNIIDRKVTVGNNEYNITCVSMGNPHAVIFVKENPDNINIEDIGRAFEKSPLFPEGVNVEFIQVIDDHTLKMRVWERGSGETLACGTGTCASVAAAVKNGYCRAGEEIKVIVKGGELFDTYFEKEMFMRGNCVTVFRGDADVDLQNGTIG